MGGFHLAVAERVGGAAGQHDGQADIGDRHNAYETLRRDKALRANLDLAHHSWIGLLRLTLGHPTATGALRHGVLARLLVGDTLADLLDDDHLVLTAVAANPAGGGRGG